MMLNFKSQCNMCRKKFRFDHYKSKLFFNGLSDVTTMQHHCYLDKSITQVHICDNKFIASVFFTGNIVIDLKSFDDQVFLFLPHDTEKTKVDITNLIYSEVLLNNIFDVKKFLTQFKENIHLI